MKSFVFALWLAGVTSLLASNEESLWSDVDNELRGRLLVLPPTEKSSRCYRVFIELQNTAKAIGSRKVRFNLDRLSFKVLRRDGTPLAQAVIGVYNGMNPRGETLVLPSQGAIRFSVSFPGIPDSPIYAGSIDLGSQGCWTIPQDSLPFFLSGALMVDRDDAVHDVQDWHGGLKLPPVEIPKFK